MSRRASASPWLRGSVGLGIFSSLALAVAPSARAQPLAPFSTRDPSFDAAMNALFDEHLLRQPFGPSPAAGNGATEWLDWDLLATGWLDTSTFDVRSASPVQNGSRDYNAQTIAWMMQLPVDRFGHVFNAHGGAEPWGRSADPPGPWLGAFGAGWPFPTYQHRAGGAGGWEYSNGSTEGWTSVSTAPLAAPDRKSVV